jgi:SEL1 protein
MHPAKRRKLHQPGSFQNKPFRSPLRPAAKLQNDTTPSHPRDSEKDPIVGSQLSPMRNNSASHRAFRRAPTHTLSDQSGSTNDDPTDLQKQYTSLSIRSAQLCQSLENAEQALQIEVSDQVLELDQLIIKWRRIAQEAADELFSDAKARIDNAGGFAAWRRRAEQDSQRWHDEGRSDQALKIIRDPGDASYETFSEAAEQQLSEPEKDEESVSQGWLLKSPERTNFAFGSHSQWK